MKAVVVVEVVVDADADVAVVMDLPVTVRIVETVEIAATAESVEMVHPVVDVVMDLAVVAVEDLVVVEAAGARRNSAWTRRPSHPWARF